MSLAEDSGNFFTSLSVSCLCCPLLYISLPCSCLLHLLLVILYLTIITTWNAGAKEPRSLGLQCLPYIIQLLAICSLMPGETPTAENLHRAWERCEDAETPSCALKVRPPQDGSS
jgi:hypothetical protein